MIKMEGELDKDLRVVRANDAVLAMGNLSEFHREMSLTVANLSFMADLQAERFECMVRRAMSSGEMKVLHYYVSSFSAKQTSPFVFTGTKGEEAS